MNDTTGGESSGDSGSILSRPWVLNGLSLTTFAVLAFAQYRWWHDHGEPFSWVLLPATPLFAFVPAGIIVKAFRKRWTAAWAEENGFRYRRSGDWAVPAWDFPPFTIGRARRFRIRDTMEGTIGDYPASFFHLTWLHNNRINVSTHYRNVFALTLPAALPRMTMGVTLDGTTGTRVEFESAEFNDRFSVYCSKPAFAHAVLTPRTIDTLVGLARQHGGAVMLTKFEIVGNLLVGVTTLGNRPRDIGGVFAAMRVIADGIPRFAWTDYGTPATDRLEPFGPERKIA
ncbi:DUF3137 domain-containing protein [Nocardia sp. ET3-3]|uniref:DUF3137 domain-containing protein n=1 Tax=Nocardia terrae TaxID=2675851 RepID=A0A7K1UST1_9NOCA|nr:DUF3137 domain-containing protein [Nocardia terrae]MVU77407.1 DUF3137 domain-containing protein [Nocardia terrae]